MAKLYELIDDSNTLYEWLASGEFVDEDGVIDTELIKFLDETKALTEEKIANTGLVLKQLISDHAALKAEKDALYKREKQAERAVEYLKDRLSQGMQLAGVLKVDTPKIALSFRKSVSVEILDESAVPSEFKEIVTEEKIKKKDITAALKAEKEVPGAVLKESQNLQVK